MTALLYRHPQALFFLLFAISGSVPAAQYLRAVGPAPGNALRLIIIIDPQTDPAFRSCDWTILLGQRAAGRYSITYFNTLSQVEEVRTFDVAADGTGGFVNNPIPALSPLGILGLALVLGISGYALARRQLRE